MDPIEESAYFAGYLLSRASLSRDIIEPEWPAGVYIHEAFSRTRGECRGGAAHIFFEMLYAMRSNYANVSQNATFYYRRALWHKTFNRDPNIYRAGEN